MKPFNPLAVQVLVMILAILFAVSPARAAGECVAIAQNSLPVHKAALASDQVQLTFIGHSTFLIESSGGVVIATDYAGFAGGGIPDAVTMNRAHPTHYTDRPDPGIRHVLRGWNADGSPARHDLAIEDVRIRNVTTDIRSGVVGRIRDGNSIFIFEVAGLCIGHLGHLHHELPPETIAAMGRLDVVLVPVDGGYTMAQSAMMQVLKEIKARIVIPMHFFGPATLARFIAAARPHFEIEFAASPMVVLSAGVLPERPKLLVLPGR
jgi:L-ascorbate metabolism protein UlaG (beta-lactamase superfamily)